MKSIVSPLFLALVCISCLLFACTGQSDTLSNTIIRTVKTATHTDVLNLFDEIGYTPERWESGIREVPRIELTKIPKRWSAESQKAPVDDKKNIFIRLVNSGVLMSNEKVIIARKRLISEMNRYNFKHNKWLHALAMKYKVIKHKTEVLDKEKLEELLQRVDIVPPSLALAQAAIESGWGASHFAIKGNSLFGQWVSGSNGIKPRQQRKNMSGFRIAAFDTPQASIDSYIHNLNTHFAYQRFREKRADFRKQDKEPSGRGLADALDKYSERGNEYVKSLHAVMDHNNLNDLDEAYLWDKGKIVVSPAI